MWKILNIEIRKLKSSGLFWTTVLLPVLLSLQTLADSGRIYGPGTTWQQLYRGVISLYANLLFPAVIAIIMSSILRAEHAGQGWKQLFTLPVRRGQVLVSKFVIGCLLILINECLMIGGIVVVGRIIGISGPVPMQMIVHAPLQAYLLALPIMVAQFLLSMVLTQPLIPIGIGVALGMPAILMANSTRYWKFYPWTYPVLTFFREAFGGAEYSRVLMYSVSGVLFVGLLVGGVVYFSRRDIV